MGNWESNRDGSWYSDRNWEARAGFNLAIPAFVIGELQSRGGDATASKLHAFLWLTRQQIPDAQVWLLLTREIRPLIDELAKTGQIRWESIRNPFSEEARITFVSDPST